MSEQTKAAVLALAATAFLLLCAWHFTRPTIEVGEKTITVLVVHKDESKRTFEISTEAGYLAEALIEADIVEENQSAYGLYILTADGETADEKAQEWWCVTKSGEKLTTGVSETPLSNGDAYELTLTTGYDS